jgi:hypothetical protein
MKRKRPRTLKSLVAGLESGKVPLRRCGSPACRSCELSPPCVFPYPTQCLARRIAEATSQPAKRVNAYVVTQRQRRAEKPNYFYFALHKARGLGSMRRRGGGGCAARPCRDWATPAGCRFGDKCRFLHGSGDRDDGAERIFVFATHGLFNGDCLRLLDGTAIEEIVVTDSIPISPSHETQPMGKVVRLGMAERLANVIQSVYEETSIHSFQAYREDTDMGRYSGQDSQAPEDRDDGDGGEEEEEEEEEVRPR